MQQKQDTHALGGRKPTRPTKVE